MYQQTTMLKRLVDGLINFRKSTGDWLLTPHALDSENQSVTPLHVFVLIVGTMLLVEGLYLFGAWIALFLSFLVVLMIGLGALSTLRDAEAFTNRPYTPYRDAYTHMRDLKNGRLHWSEAVNTWRGSISSFSLFG